MTWSRRSMLKSIKPGKAAFDIIRLFATKIGPIDNMTSEPRCGRMQSVRQTARAVSRTSELTSHDRASLKAGSTASACYGPVEELSQTQGGHLTRKVSILLNIQGNRAV